ncbi:MAG: ZIP family metal transporter [Myxococcales bacterium]
MNELTSLLLYSAAIVAGTLGGGAIPLFVGERARRTELLLAFSAGVMLGAAFFQMLPVSLHEGGLGALPLVLVGFLVLFILERFVLVHTCEEPEGCEVHGALGLTAFVGLSAHTMFDGVALGSSLSAGVGGLVFLAVVAHKIPASIALSAILVHERYKRSTSMLMLLGFALTVPLGAGVYFLIRRFVDVEHFTAYALAFSSGTFLYLALADLLPQVHRKVGMRAATVLALLAGIALMLAMGHLGGHDH